MLESHGIFQISQTGLMSLLIESLYWNDQPTLSENILSYVMVHPLHLLLQEDAIFQ